jgi:acetyltransferase-like isoleucine patch superfamily enzyme
LVRRIYRKVRNHSLHEWRRFWLERASRRGRFGRLAARIVSWNVPPYQQRAYLADLTPRGFIAPGAAISHPDLRLGHNVYIGDGVIIYQTHNGGAVDLRDGVHLYGDTFVETGSGGVVHIGVGTHVQPGCHIHAHLTDVEIGENVEIAPGCAFYTYDHGMAPGVPLMEQPLTSRGGIKVGDGAWIGFGVTVLQGVRIGNGAVIAAGAVVVHDIPANAIAGGIPAKVLKYREAGPDRISESPQRESSHVC